MIAGKKILYIDGAGPFGGAGRSLFEAVSCLKEKERVRPFFWVARGSSNRYYERIAEDIITTSGMLRFDNTEYSYYRGVRWVVLLRELMYMPFTLFSLLKVKKKWVSIDLIHVNEVTELIPGLLAKKIFKCPLIVHVRSVQSVKRNIRTKVINRILHSVDGVICIDETVARSVGSSNKVVIHNSFTVNGDEVDSKIRNKIANYAHFFKVGFVGNFQKVKGIVDLVEAARILKNKPGIKFLIVGDETEKKSILRRFIENVTRLSQDAKECVLDIIKASELESNVIFFGRTGDISAAYENFDVLCFPSHFDAPGRPVFEAAFFKVPSIVCVKNPTRDTVIPDVTGLIIPEKNPEKLAEAIEFLANDRERSQRMGAAAYELALENFTPQKNTIKLATFYQSVLGGV